MELSYAGMVNLLDSDVSTPDVSINHINLGCGCGPCRLSKSTS